MKRRLSLREVTRLAHFGSAACCGKLPLSVHRTNPLRGSALRAEPVAPME
jgi:hypothetical protein